MIPERRPMPQKLKDERYNDSVKQQEKTKDALNVFGW